MIRGFELGLAARMATWALVLPLLKRLRPVSSLARLMWREGVQERDRDRERRVLALASTLYRRRPILGDNCLERSLLLYRFLSEAGAAPALVLGANRESDSIIGHAWIVLDGNPIDRHAASFQPIVAFAAEGKPEPAALADSATASR